MGKIKKKRNLHLPAAIKQKNRPTESCAEKTAKQSQCDTLSAIDTQSTTGILKAKSSCGSVRSNAFSSVSIPQSILHQKLPEFDVQTRITNKTLRCLNLKKKEKMKIRHEAFIEKINLIQSEKRKAAERKKKGRTAVVGDLTDMSESLPTLELLLRQMESKNEPPVAKERSTPSGKFRMKRTREDMKLFKQVLDHPQFKADPGVTIAEHLRNKMNQEMDT